MCVLEFSSVWWCVVACVVVCGNVRSIVRLCVIVYASVCGSVG